MNGPQITSGHEVFREKERVCVGGGMWGAKIKDGEVWKKMFVLI